MFRSISHNLLSWKNSHSRKVLLVRGARQVGKTYSVRELGETFEFFLEANFEKDREIHNFFSGSLDPKMICQKMSSYYSVPIIQGKTLVFFDEIQACPDAISSLRFFYENIPDIHIIAAGSLLEFAIEEIPSYGVGRIQHLFMYPMSFDEFLAANSENGLLIEKKQADHNAPLEKPFHDKLLDYLKLYYLIGGMPEIVSNYISDKNIINCQKLLDNLIESLKDDFAKYKKRAPVQRLREVFLSIPRQTGSKFIFSNIDSDSRHGSLKEALDMLVQAGLAYKIFHSSARGIPLGAQIKHKRFKVILFDIGMHQRILKTDAGSILTAENVETLNKGNIAEMFAGSEIIKYASHKLRQDLYYWHREKRGSTAEVDYLIEKKGSIIPIEVKSGTRGKMHSMQIFLKERNLKTGIRLSLEPFSSYDNIMAVPLYALSNVIGGERDDL
jgi:uncharacterized protein